MTILISIISYIIGSFSFSYVIGKIIRNIDIRNFGSGNAGATNSLRVMGKKLGIIIGILDTLKGMIAALIGLKFMGYEGALIASLFVVIGHDWSIFLKFKGGKGIATSFGTLLVLNFPTAVISMAIGLIIVFYTRYASLGFLTFLSLTPIVSSIIMEKFDMRLFLFTTAITFLGLWRHKANIRRLLCGSENKFDR